MTKQEILRSINRAHPGVVLLNTGQVAALFGKHYNYASKITKDLDCVKRDGTHKLYFVDDVAELIMKSAYRGGKV